MKLHRGLFPSRINSKMAFLNMSLLLLFILVVSKTNTQAKLVYHNIEINEDDGLNKNDAIDVQDGNQLVRPRRSVVSTNVTDCYKGFFASRQPPSGFRNNHTNIRYICQQVPGNTVDYFYSTMFDVNYGIPIYSAYVIRQAQASQFGTAPRGVDNWRQEVGITKQASDEAYAGQTIHAKGHLLPAETYSFSDAHMLSTFTYTNAVPQIAVFNSGQWAQYERRIREYATNNCSPQGGDLYLITGISEASIQSGPSGLEAIQGTLGALKPKKYAISIPKSMWTAGCCINTSRGALGAFAVIGNNLKDKTKVHMSEVNMTELQSFLLTGVNGFGGPTISLFPANPGCSDTKKKVNFRKRPATS